MFESFEKYRRVFNTAGLELTKELYEKFDIYAEFLVEYNKKVNLTAITEPDDIFLKHFTDSVMICKYIDLPEGSSMIDIGTGAGFPLVPVRLYRDDLKITLLDSLGKRVTFLRKLCEKLGIDAEIIHSRAEDAGKTESMREKFDYSCARAVANISVLSELCIPFVRTGGYFISMKGPGEDISLGEKAINILGGMIERKIEYDLSDEKRRLIVIRKISTTPDIYPRNSKKIKKESL